MSRREVRKDAIGDSVSFSRHWSTFWRVTQRTVQRWVKIGNKVDDISWMIDWSRSQKRLPHGFRSKVEELEIETAGNDLSDYLTGSEPESGQVDPDHSAEETPQESILRLDRLRRHYARRLDEANRRNALGDIKFFSDQVIRFEESLRKQRLMADRLGLDTGELIRRDTIERWLGGLAFWLMRGVDQSITVICPKLAGLTFPEEVRPILEDYLLDHRFFDPLVKSVGLQAGVELPKWFVDRLIDVVDDYIENGAAEAAKVLEGPLDAA